MPKSQKTLVAVEDSSLTTNTQNYNGFNPQSHSRFYSSNITVRGI